MVDLLVNRSISIRQTQNMSTFEQKR